MRVASSPALSFLLLAATATVDAFSPISIGRPSTNLAGKASTDAASSATLAQTDNFKSSPRWRKKTKQVGYLSLLDMWKK